MKIYQQTPNALVRLQIAKLGEETQYVTFCECTMNEVEEMCKTLIESQKLSPFETGKKTSINIRESLGGDNGKSKSISFRGLSAKQTFDLIVNYVKNTNGKAP